MSGRASVNPGASPTRVRIRAALTYAGAAALAIGPFLIWLRPPLFSAFQLSWRIFYRFYFTARQHIGRHQRGARPLTSAGFVFLVLAAIVLGGLLVRRGWLTSTAGALAVVAAVGYLLTINSNHLQLHYSLVQLVGPGPTVVIIGGLLAFAAGWFGPLPPRRRSVLARRAVPTEPPPRPDARSTTADDWWERTRGRREA